MNFAVEEIKLLSYYISYNVSRNLVIVNFALEQNGNQKRSVYNAMTVHVRSFAIVNIQIKNKRKRKIPFVCET